jgi:hypothetical protein
MVEDLPGIGLAAAADGPALTPALRLQILSTEHWSLLASRGLAWNEAFSRASMFLSTLSAVMVALALIAQANAFGSAFVLFALVILPVALFVGIATYLRLDSANYHDALCVMGMNRIRGAYLELAPEIEQYFVMSGHDDIRGMAISMGVDGRVGTLAQMLAATPTLVAILNSVLVGAIATLLADQVGATTVLMAGVGVGGFLASALLHGWYGQRRIAQIQGVIRPLFPSPDRA